MAVRAVRGAIQVEANEQATILAGTAELVTEVMSRNKLSTDQVISVIFSATGDLNAEFPALAARKLGFQEVPLLCCSEIPVPGAMPRVVRLMMHVETELSRPAGPACLPARRRRAAAGHRPVTTGSGGEPGSAPPTATGPARCPATVGGSAARRSHVDRAGLTRGRGTGGRHPTWRPRHSGAAGRGHRGRPACCRPPGRRTVPPTWRSWRCRRRR